MSDTQLTYTTTPPLLYWKYIQRFQSALLNLQYNKDVLGTPTPTPFFEQDNASIFGIAFESNEGNKNRMVAWDIQGNRSSFVNVFPPEQNLNAYAFFTANDINTIESGLYSVKMQMYVVINSEALLLDWNILEPWFIRQVGRKILKVKEFGSIQDSIAVVKKKALEPLQGMMQEFRFYYPPYNAIRFDFTLRASADACGDLLSQDLKC